MKIKTSELIGAALDWAVATIMRENYRIKEKDGLTKHIVILHSIPCPDKKPGCAVAHSRSEYYSPSTDWAQGGPIIEREKIDTLTCDGGDYWQAHIYLRDEQVEQFGPTPLIAAMRAFVASRLGDEIDIPEELL